MIITRTPLRISLGGGGTDLPSYYERFGGSLISAAIQKYVFVSINRTFGHDYVLKYSQLEQVDRVDDISHPIFREVLRRHQIGPSIELVSVADIPAGTGLGSSGTFTVGLLRAVYAFLRKPTTAAELAEEACDIEINVLGRPVGKQDQYAAAYGGLTSFDFDRDGTVRATPLALDDRTLVDLSEHLIMFFTGYSRDAGEVLAEQQKRSSQDDRDMLENLHAVKELGLASKEALERGDTVQFAELMDTHWEHKRRRSSSISNPRIDRCYQLAMESGALGGKLVGAGAGGFLLFYAKDADSVRRTMASEGLTEVHVAFDHDGSSVLVRN